MNTAHATTEKKPGTAKEAGRVAKSRHGMGDAVTQEEGDNGNEASVMSKRLIGWRFMIRNSKCWVAQARPIDIWTKLFATGGAFCFPLNSRAMLGRNAARSGRPLRQKHRDDAQ